MISREILDFIGAYENVVFVIKYGDKSNSFTAGGVNVYVDVEDSERRHSAVCKLCMDEGIVPVAVMGDSFFMAELSEGVKPIATVTTAREFDLSDYEH